jgi:hypothetical protein
MTYNDVNIQFLASETGGLTMPDQPLDLDKAKPQDQGQDLEPRGQGFEVRGQGHKNLASKSRPVLEEYITGYREINSDNDDEA